MKKDILTRAFPPELVKQRQGQGGKMLSYVETHAVIARLNEGCEQWSFEIVEHQILDDEVVVVGKLTVEGTIIKMAFGGSAITRDQNGRHMSIADDLKASGSDALKKAASLLGVGLELYGAGSTAPPDARPDVPRPSQPADRLTGKQYSTLQSVTRRQNIGRNELRELLEGRFRKSELAHLSRREASSLLSELMEANGAHR